MKLSVSESAAASKPKTRRALLLQVLRNNLVDFIVPNLCTILFWIPTVLVSSVFIVLIYINWGNADFSPSSAAVLYLLLFTFCSTIAGPSQLSAVQLARDFARGRYYGGAASCFWNSLKENAVSGFFRNLISGLMLLVLFLVCRWYLSLSGTLPVLIIPFVLFLTLTWMWYLIQPCLGVMLVTYALPFPQAVFNSLALTLQHFFPAVLLFALKLIPPVAFVLFLCYTHSTLMAALAVIAITLYYVSIGVFLPLVMDASYGNMLCEEALNIQLAGSSVDIGLASEHVVPPQE